MVAEPYKNCSGVARETQWNTMEQTTATQHVTIADDCDLMHVSMSDGARLSSKLNGTFALLTLFNTICILNMLIQMTVYVIFELGGESN